MPVIKINVYYLLKRKIKNLVSVLSNMFHVINAL